MYVSIWNARTRMNETVARDVATGRPLAGPYDLGGDIKVSPDGKSLIGIHDEARGMRLAALERDGREANPRLAPARAGRDVSSTRREPRREDRIRDLRHPRRLGQPMLGPRDGPAAGPVRGVPHPADLRPIRRPPAHDARRDHRRPRPRDGPGAGARVQGGGGILHYTVGPDGRTVIALAADLTIRSWVLAAGRLARPAEGEEAADEPASGPLPPAWRDFFTCTRSCGPTGRSSCPRPSVPMRRWSSDVRSRPARPIGAPARHRFDAIRCVAFSPDGATFATGTHRVGRLVGEVRLWETATGRLLRPPMPHTNYVQAVAFRPDGRVLAAGDYHGLVRTWDTTTGREVGQPLRQGSIVASLAYSPRRRGPWPSGSISELGKPGVRALGRRDPPADRRSAASWYWGPTT